jgi:hypothetical protein
LSLTPTSPLRLCTAELSDLVLACPAGHSASPWDASSAPLVHVYSTMKPMHVMGASLQTKPLSTVVMPVAYRDSYPDTIMTSVKIVPLLPGWTWTVFLFFMFWNGALVCLILQNHWWLNQIAISPKSLFFGVFSALCFRQ